MKQHVSWLGKTLCGLLLGFSLSAPLWAQAITLTSPANNQVFANGANIVLSASVSASSTSIPTKVEFYWGNTLIGTDTTAPFSVTWSNAPAGSYSLTAKATNNWGTTTTTTTSAPVTVTVGATSGSVYYLHTDHLNTPRLVTDEQNTVVWRNQALAEPFGTSPPEEDPDANGLLFTLNLRFPGQYFDKETNLSYNYFRDYDPTTGRYIQSDPIGLAGGINTYAYVGGDPINGIDPDGLLKINLLDKTKDPGLYEAAENQSDDPTMCIVFSHGSSQTVDGRNAVQLNALLKRRGCKPKQPVKLDSCRTGQGDNSIAEQLAKLRKSTVIAPDTPVWTSWWNTSYPFAPMSEDRSSDWNSVPNISKPGNWRTFDGSQR